MFNFGGSGTNANNTANSGSLFGNKPATTSGGFSGGMNSGNLPGQQSGSLFGQNNNIQQPNQSSGGLFGQQNAGTAPSGGLFGNKPAGGFSIGQNTTQQQQPQANVQKPGQLGGSLFGNNNTTQQQNSGIGSGGLFGSNTQQQSNPPAGGLFGASNQQQPASGGLFGKSSQTQPGATSGGLFGNNQPQSGPSSGGLFGGSSNSGSGGLFGNSSNTFANNKSSTSGGLFGANTSQQQPQQQQPQGTSLFGNSGTVNSTKPSFGWSQSSNAQPIGQQANQPQPQEQHLQQQMQYQQQQIQQLQQSNYPQQIQEQIVKCKDSWDPRSSRSKLRTFLYNKVNETEAMLYSKPSEISQEDWDEALLQKPSASVIPVQAFGFDDLNERNKLQRDNVAQARLILNQVLEKLIQLSQKHDLETASRILKAQSRNVKIQQRIIKLGSHLAILKSKGLPLTVGEENMWLEYEKLLKRSNDPAGLGKNNELWARLSVLKERSKTISDQLDSTLVVISENNGGDVQPKRSGKYEDQRVDEELETRVNKIAEILSNQQRGLCYLQDVIEKDEKLVDRYVSQRST
ncbi:LAFA_0D07250g1_1 [Lachancea sp. 'fantastica']|nr:LAFA_0D07250g1_1 [Lachancea sp. 'fantastica']